MMAGNSGKIALFAAFMLLAFAGASFAAVSIDKFPLVDADNANAAVLAGTCEFSSSTPNVSITVTDRLGAAKTMEVPCTPSARAPSLAPASGKPSEVTLTSHFAAMAAGPSAAPEAVDIPLIDAVTPPVDAVTPPADSGKSTAGAAGMPDIVDIPPVDIETLPVNGTWVAEFDLSGFADGALSATASQAAASATMASSKYTHNPVSLDLFPAVNSANANSVTLAGACEFSSSTPDVSITITDSLGAAKAGTAVCAITGDTAGSSLCYQEAANVSTACGGLATGAYWAPADYFFDPPDYLTGIQAYDGDWNTYSATIVADPSAGFMANYTIPNGTAAATWQVKLGLSSWVPPSPEPGTYNISITHSCLSGSTLQLKALYNADTMTREMSCWDGAAFQNVATITNMSNEFYEEAMVWAIATAPVPGVWSSTLDLSGLADGTLFAAAAQLGNSATAASGKDATPPEISLSSPASGASTTDKQPSFVWNSTDAMGAVTCTIYIDGVEAASGPALQAYVPSAPLSLAAHSWNVSCTDAAGNMASAASRTLSITEPAAPAQPAPQSQSSSGNGGGSTYIPAPKPAPEPEAPPAPEPALPAPAEIAPAPPEAPAPEPAPAPVVAEKLGVLPVAAPAAAPAEAPRASAALFGIELSKIAIPAAMAAVVALLGVAGLAYLFMFKAKAKK